MKRLFVAAGLAVAALSLPATAALADGYERHAKSKPQLKRKAPKHHAKRRHPHVQYQEKVRDFGAIYCCERSHASYSFQQFEKTESSYYEERNGHRFGPVTSYSERYVNPQQGCYAHAPCGYSTGVPAHFYYGGHPGGVGYGVDGGPVYGGSTVFIVPGGGFRSHHAHGAASASARAHGSSHSYYSGHGGMSHGFYGGGYGHAGAAFPPAYGHPGYPHPGKSWGHRR